MSAQPKILPLSLRGLYFEAGGKRLLKDIDLDISPGGSLIILGANGAGKSLLLRICHGLMPPSGGSIKWSGPKADEAPRHQAMVFQRPVMLRRTALQNIDYALSLQGIGKAERRERAELYIQKTGLRRLKDRPARVLSGGEQQRLALARAWSIAPEVLFLDEPTANLDPAATYQVEEVIQAIKAEGTKIVMTTHDLGQAKRLADDVLFLHQGRIKEQAKASDFFNGPKNDLAQAFLKGELLWWTRKNSL